MRPPDFWSRPASGLGGHARVLCLAPLAAIWTLAGRVRRWRTKGARAGIPIVCIGNVVAGGAGKTPTALAVAARLRAMGRKPVFLSRGHGGRLAGPVLVDPAQHDAADVGDEPLLLAAAGPAIVARDRVAGAALAAAHGDVVVMDDGFQNPAVAHDLSLLVVDGEVWFGNGRVIPAGPLREPLADALSRADALLVVGGGRSIPSLPPGAPPVLRARLVPRGDPGLDRRAVVAFAGIGRPEKFFATLRSLGARIVAAHSFGDHHRYTDADLARLRTEAKRVNATLVTTAKDAARLSPAAREGIAIVEIDLVPDDPVALGALLRRIP